MASSGVPAVPCTSSVESPEMAAARCSANQDLATPGSPRSSRARSVARVATATSTRRRSPMYLGLISKPLASRVPSRYSVTAQGERRQDGGRARLSSAASCSSSAANSSSACCRRTSVSLSGALSIILSIELCAHGQAIVERLRQRVEQRPDPCRFDLELEEAFCFGQHACIEPQRRAVEES